jgi:hypothetical protein
MTEIEVPLEHVHEEIQHQAQHSPNRFTMHVALTAAFLAVFAAIAALIAGQYANEAMKEQILASDLWAHYQAKSIKATVLNAKIEILAEQGKSLSKDHEKIEEYAKEQEELSEKAKEEETHSKIALHLHEIMARAVTFFQVAIALSAVAVLTSRKQFWYISLGLGVLGAGFFVQGLL